MLGTQITPWGCIYWTLIFYNLKKLTSRSILWEVKLSFEFTRSWSLSCSNIAIFKKLQILAYNLRIGQNSEFARLCFISVVILKPRSKWHKALTEVVVLLCHSAANFILALLKDAGMNINLNNKTQGLKISFSSNYFVMCSKQYNSLTKKYIT